MQQSSQLEPQSEPQLEPARVYCSTFVCSATSVRNDDAATTAGSDQATCCTDYTVHSLTLSGTLDDLLTEFGSVESFAEDFSITIASLIDGVAAENVTVTSVEAGSVVVEFYVATDSVALDAAIAEQLEAALQPSDEGQQDVAIGMLKAVRCLPEIQPADCCCSQVTFRSMRHSQRGGQLARQRGPATTRTAMTR